MSTCPPLAVLLSQPPNWPVKACDLGENATYTECTAFGSDAECTYNPWSAKYGSSGFGYENEDLIVWMRTAALPNFRKLYRKIRGNIENEKYMFTIGYNFPVASFSGKKKVVLLTLT